MVKLCSVSLLLTFLMTAIGVQKANAQGLELNAGWAHISGNGGTDGLAVGAAYWFSRRVTLALNYDTAWDTSSFTNFALTSIGQITAHSHTQNALIGPRFFFTTNWTDKHKLVPFAEAQFGESWLDQNVTQPTKPTIASSDHAFTWMLGGGLERAFANHWSGRMNVDFLRTHFADQGQTSLRFVLGITYTFRDRVKP